MPDIGFFIFLLATLPMAIYAIKVKYFSEPSGLKKDNWQEINNLANEMGLNFSDNPHEDHNGGWIHGTYRDVTISVQDQAVRHSGRHGEYLVITTLFEAFLSDVYANDGIEVVREGLITKIAKAFGSQDIQIGDEAFDKAFIIRAPSEEAAQKFFARAEVRENFLNLQRMRYDFKYQYGILTLEYNGCAFETPDKIQERIEALASCARAIMNLNNASQPAQPESTQTVLDTSQPTLLEPPQNSQAESEDYIEDTAIHW